MAPLDVVLGWVAAVNALDVRGVMSRSTLDIELGGPRGTTRGALHLREWVERARLHMETRRAFAARDRIVLLQHVRWRDHAGFTVAEASVANRFTVAGDRVAAVIRHDDLADALREAGLSEADEVTAAIEQSGHDAGAARGPGEQE